MAHSTPYELRFQMYGSALERLKEQYFAKLEEVLSSPTDGGSMDIPFPTANDAIAEASIIMDFVNGDKLCACK